MAYRVRLLSRPTSSTASNKIRFNAKGGTVEIESWVEFVSNHVNDIEQLT